MTVLILPESGLMAQDKSQIQVSILFHLIRIPTDCGAVCSAPASYPVHVNGHAVDEALVVTRSRSVCQIRRESTMHEDFLRPTASQTFVLQDKAIKFRRADHSEIDVGIIITKLLPSVAW